MIKRVFALMLCAILCVSLIPAVFAAEDTLWEKVDTGEVVAMSDEPTEEEMQNLTLHIHSFTPWMYTDSIYCDESGGVRRRVCSKCGFEETEIIGTMEHEFVWSSTVREPTCTSEGYGYQKCKACGLVQEVIIPMTQHVFGDWSIITEATDHSAGIRERTCYACGFTQSVSFDPSGTLKRGDGGPAVREIQALLAQQGFLQKGYVDGDYGFFTEKAVMEFQQAVNLLADGIAWPQTINLLHHKFGEWEVVKEPDYYSVASYERVCEDCGYKETKEIGVMLTLGDSNADVKALQKRLNAFGYDVGNPDGLFGDGTRREVKNYQKDQGFEEDGIVWPGVWSSLFPETLSEMPVKTDKAE